ncbi:cysteine desulfurase family protein [Microbacterium sp. LS_15]|uniref:cysteine desulfurase family protein n=1 Tax=Microbacterium sp. LS_15 TaxID=3055790 RepID=UPI0035BED1D5
MLYLDHAATSPLRLEVRDAMLPYLTGAFGNPSSHHTVGEAAAQALDEARSRVATVLGFRSGDVIFTGGGTEANNLAVKGIVLAALDRGRRHVIVSSIEHESVLAPADYLHRFHGVAVTHLPVDRTGRVSTDDLRRALREDTALVSVDQANNEIGTVQDIPALRAVTSAAGVPLHVDAVQSAGWLPLRDLGADAVTVAGHKIGAPQGIGVLAVRGRVPIEPLLHGGGQERGRRSGTENVAGAVALATALELAASEQRAVHEAVGEATTRFIERVLTAVPQAALTGHPHSRLPGSASFTFAGVNGETVLLELERRGIVSSSGSACAADSGEPSHVLLACGFDPDLAQTAVRFTFGRAALPPGVPDRLADAVADAVRAAAGT